MSLNSTYSKQNDTLAATGEGHFWGADEVKARLREAAQVLRGLSLGSRDFPARLAAAWPDVVRQGMDAYGYAAPSRRPVPPTPAAVSRADEAVLWLIWLEDEARRIVWARASKIPWRQLEDMDGRSHMTLRRIEAAGLDALCRRLNAPLGREAAVAAAFRQGRASRENDSGNNPKKQLTKFIK